MNIYYHKIVNHDFDVATNDIDEARVLNLTNYISDKDCVEIDGVWHLNLSQPSLEEIKKGKEKSVKSKRNELLLETDKYCLTDSPKMKHIKKYREWLRNYTELENWFVVYPLSYEDFMDKNKMKYHKFCRENKGKAISYEDFVGSKKHWWKKKK